MTDWYAPNQQTVGTEPASAPYEPPVEEVPPETPPTKTAKEATT